MSAIINITAPAREYILDLLSRNPGKSFGLGYDNKGCSGHKYTFDLVDPSSAKQGDEIIDLGGAAVVVDARSILGLIGSTLDLEGDAFQTSLVWHNPMAINKCGCGQSFQLGTDSGCSR